MFKRLFLTVSMAMVFLSACGGGIEVGNPSSTKLRGFLTAIPQNNEAVYRAVFLKNQEVAIQRHEGATLSSYQRQNNEVSLAGDFSNNIQMQMDFTVNEIQDVTQLDLQINNVIMASSYQDHLGEASTQVAGNYVLVNNECQDDGQPLTIGQNGNSLNLQGAFNYGDNDYYSGNLDGEAYITWVQQKNAVTANCQASVVGVYLSGACKVTGAMPTLCTFVYQRLVD